MATRWGFDEVNGIVIGDIDTRKHYTFHDKKNNIIASGNFENDREAELYIKAKQPVKYNVSIPYGPTPAIGSKPLFPATSCPRPIFALL